MIHRILDVTKSL